MGIRESPVPRLKIKDGWQPTPITGLTDWKADLWFGPDLDGEATIGVTDVLQARDAWLEDAPAQYRRLLDAKPEPPKGRDQ